MYTFIYPQLGSGIIIKWKKIAMIHSLQYDYYKFPGVGIKNDKNPIHAMIRETHE